MAFIRVFSSALFASVCAAAADRMYCGQYQTQTSASTQNIFSTNEWGADGSGALCLTLNNDDTQFNATWNWNKNQDAVHAFPNVELYSAQLPVQLLNLSSLTFDVSWSMAPSDSSEGELSAIGPASADVVLDMFLDPNPALSSSTTSPEFEVMVWMGQYGFANPIGSNGSTSTAPKGTYDLNGTQFSLYTGPNGNGQTVFTWLAGSNITTFNKDISPLFGYLTEHNFLPNTTYLGIVQFGTETFHATSNVTFSATDFNMKIVQGAKKSMAIGGVVPNLALISLVGLSGIMALL